MANYNYVFEEFYVRETLQSIQVKFRNPSTNFLLMDSHAYGGDLKIIAERNFTITKPKLSTTKPNPIRPQLFDMHLEATIEKFGCYEISRPKKITKKEKLKINSKEKISAAREYIRNGFSIKVISMYTGLKAQKVYAIRKKMKERKAITDQPKGAKTKLKREHLSWFQDIFQIKRYNIMTIKELREKFFDRFHLDTKFITISGLRKCLRKKLKLRWKRISFYKHQQIEQKAIDSRFEYIVKIIPYFVSNWNLVFLDECSFNLNLNRKMGWNISSKRLYMVDVEKSENYSLLGAINQNKLIAFIVTRGSILTEIYTFFISKLIDLFIKENIIERTVFLCDGATIHRSKFFNKVYENKHNFIFIPIYSPELNPIELCWSKWKREVRRGGSVIGEDDLIFRIAKAGKSINSNDCKAWFKHSISFFKKSYLKQCFY